MKIKYKITVLFTLLVTTILLLLSISVYYFSSLQRMHVFTQRLKSRAGNYANLFSLFNYSDSSRIVLGQIDSASVSVLPHKSVAIYDYTDKQVYAYDASQTSRLMVNRATLSEARLNGEIFFSVQQREAFVMQHGTGKNSIVVVVAAFDEDGWDRLRELRNILLISFFIGIAIAAATGYVFSHQLVRPIAQIIHEVKDISSQNLSHRIQAGTSQDELNQLANTFNELLNRLQESFQIQRRFISNASHELSTPLTSISSQLEVTLQKERNTEEYRQVIQSIREDVQHMQQLNKSLLEIAKAGSEGGIELQEVRMDEVLFKAMADVQKISPAYRVDVHFGDFPDDENLCLVFGNYELLYSSLKNIIENGCKFSPDHVTSVELQFISEEVMIQVKNEGDIIAEQELEHIFQPFYRTPAASAIKGFGLGLALAKRIISLHKGSIKVQSDIATGTIFTIILPSVKVFSSR